MSLVSGLYGHPGFDRRPNRRTGRANETARYPQNLADLISENQCNGDRLSSALQASVSSRRFEIRSINNHGRSRASGENSAKLAARRLRIDRERSDDSSFDENYVPATLNLARCFLDRRSYVCWLHLCQRYANRYGQVVVKTGIRHLLAESTNARCVLFNWKCSNIWKNTSDAKKCFRQKVRYREEHAVLLSI